MTESIHARYRHRCQSHASVAAVLLLLITCGHAAGQDTEDKSSTPLPSLTRIQVRSSLDGTNQPSLIQVPPAAVKERTPMLVFLHSWSGDLRQKNVQWQAQAMRRGWIYLHPNFRGVNSTPQACGSKFARQDILDAIEAMQAKYNVDPDRIYLAGSSGGGHMAMLMAGHHPDRFSAVSSWVGISDLAQWYRFHLKDDVPQRYARMILDCLGGAPGTSAEIDRQYRERSPRFHLQHATDVPIDIYSGVNDGHTGSVPIHHSLDAFNVIATANGDAPVTAEEISQLTQERRLKAPSESDLKAEPAIGRAIQLRRRSGQARVTIFEGGHESLVEPACHWLAQQVRATTPGVATK